jgi:hypothetical protein
MQDVTTTAEAVVDIRPYVEAIGLPSGPASELREVEHIHRDADEKFDQALIGTDQPKLYRVIVVDLAARGIDGQHLLGLTAEYDLPCWLADGSKPD